MWHYETHVNLSCQPLHRSTDVQPLATGLSNQQVISWQVFSYLPGHPLSIRYNYLLAVIFKLRIISNIIYKLLAIIYKLIIICKGYNNPYK